jgi:transposase
VLALLHQPPRRQLSITAIYEAVLVCSIGTLRVICTVLHAPVTAIPARLHEHQMTVIFHQLFNLDRSVDNNAQEHGVNKRSVRKWRLNWKLFGSPRPPRHCKIGRPRVCSLAQEDALIQHINENPSIYLDEMTWFLYDCFGVKSGILTVFELLARYGWSRKKASKLAAQP